MNKEILNKVDEIISEIEKSEIYQKYLFLKKQIENNRELKSLINKIKVMQKDVVHNIEKQDKLDVLINELNNHPLYREYNNTIYEINNIFNIIEANLNKYFYDKLN